ncbi:MAG: hypothetical protein WCR54_08630 [Clostridia bacterium]
MDNFTTVLYPILFTLLAGFVSYALKESVKLIPQVVKLLVAKIGLTNYTKGKAVAVDVFKKVNENNRLGLLANTKADEFETLIKKKIPNITDADISLFRQSIADDYNKNKPAIEKVLEPVKADPVIKYYAADGITELQPIPTFEPVK